MSNKNIQFVAVIAIILGVFAVVAFVPLVEVSYTIEVPVNSTDSHREQVFSKMVGSLSEDYFSWEDEKLEEGRNYIFSFGASGIVDAYIFTQNQFTSYRNGLLTGQEEVLRARSGKLEYIPDETARYYFVLSNREFNSITIRSFSCMSEWDEIITEYETQVVIEKITILRNILGDN